MNVRAPCVSSNLSQQHHRRAVLVVDERSTRGLLDPVFLKQALQELPSTNRHPSAWMPTWPSMTPGGNRPTLCARPRHGRGSRRANPLDSPHNHLRVALSPHGWRRRCSQPTPGRGRHGDQGPKASRRLGRDVGRRLCFLQVCLDARAVLFGGTPSRVGHLLRTYGRPTLHTNRGSPLPCRRHMVLSPACRRRRAAFCRLPADLPAPSGSASPQPKLGGVFPRPGCTKGTGTARY
mmetsp:Transcript_120521/g.300644  ORF Transcript_120521/g.300644 Transcript_120521/m.300644 type:complete len:235 (+) Transcript_120521:1358-2062(+)